MKTLLRAIGLLAALPALCLAGFFVASIALDPDFEPVDMADPSPYLAVVGAWNRADGSLACRAFYTRDLENRPGSLPLRFRLTQEELADCAVAFEAFSREHEWPDDLDWARDGYYARVERPDPSDPDLMAVSYPLGDDSPADTRYRIDRSTREPTDFEFRGFFGPAWGLSVVITGGAGGIVVWLGLVLWLAIGWLARRGAPGNASAPS